MANKVILSKQWALSARDWLKSALFAVGTPVLFEVQKTLQTGSLNIDWKQLGTIAISAFGLYLGKQLISAPKVTTTYDSNSKAAEIAEEIKS